MASKSNNKRGTPQPPQRIQSLNFTSTVRFAATATLTNSDWLTNEIMDQWFVATSATTGYRLFDAIRVKRIEMWCAALSSATASNTLISIEETPGIYLSGRNRILQDMVVGTARAAHVVWTPMASTNQAFFVTSGTATNTSLFRFTAPIGTVIDVTYEFVLADGSASPVGVVGAISGATTGQVYCRSISRNGTTSLPPVSISTN